MSALVPVRQAFKREQEICFREAQLLGGVEVTLPQGDEPTSPLLGSGPQVSSRCFLAVCFYGTKAVPPRLPSDHSGRRVFPSWHRPQEPWREAECCRSYVMAWTSVLLMLVVHLTGCGPQPMLHQPPAASSLLGTTIRLSCALSSNHNINIYSIYWYQQHPGHPPRFLLRYFSRSDNHQGPKVPPRFSGSKDVARNLGYLRIAQLQPEDEAVYYCAMGLQSQEKESWMDMERGGEK